MIARNEIRTIKTCLDSLMENQVDEVVVVDGMSTDGTSQVIDKYPVLHVYDKGEGPAAARNIGLKMCTGGYLVIIDADQWIPQGFDSKLKEILSANDYNVVFCPLIWVGSSAWAKARRAESIAAKTIVTPYLSSYFFLPRVYQLSYIIEVDGWNVDLLSFEDFDLWKRIKKLDPKVFSSSLVICHDASNISVLTEFQRGREVCSSLFLYVKNYPSEWLEFVNVTVLNLIVGLVISSEVFLGCRDIKTAIRVLFLRTSRWIGWIVGLFFPGRS